MYIQYPSNSPYEATPQLSWRMGIFTYRPIVPDKTDSQFILDLRHQYRPDKLSYELYQSPCYWWVFCERNPFLRANPIWDFVAGLEITVPSHDYLTRLIGG